MRDSDDVKENLPAVDGFDDAEDRTEGVEEQQSGRIIQGERLRFTNDFVWVTGDDEEFPKDRELVVLDTVRLVQKWIDQMPVETIFVEHGQKWPDIDKLNEACPKSEWKEGPNGQFQGPWQRSRVTYFVDLKTMQRYTHASGTVGTDICVREFRDEVSLMRRFRGERVYAVVTLADAYMPTRWGGRQRPDYRIMRWILLGPEGTALPSTSSPPPALTDGSAANSAEPDGAQEVEEPPLGEQLDDEISF